MAYTLVYEHQLPYFHDGLRLFPGFRCTLSTLDRRLEVQAVAALDCGAEVSLFDGTLARILEIDLMAGRKLSFASTTGVSVHAYVHPVSIAIPEVGEVGLNVAFSTGPLLRNLLGRDLFYAFKIGLEERHGRINLTPEPD